MDHKLILSPLTNTYNGLSKFLNSASGNTMWAGVHAAAAGKNLAAGNMGLASVFGAMSVICAVSAGTQIAAGLAARRSPAPVHNQAPPPS